MKAINQRLIIYDPFSWFFSPSWWKRIRVKGLLGDIPVVKSRLKEQPTHQLNHGNLMLLPLQPQGRQRNSEECKCSSEPFLCIRFISGALITRETLKLKPSLHKTGKATIHSLFNPEGVHVSCSRQTLTDLARVVGWIHVPPMLTPYIGHLTVLGWRWAEFRKCFTLEMLAELRVRREQHKTPLIWGNALWRLLPPAPPPWPWLTLMLGCTFAPFLLSPLLWEVVHQVRAGSCAVMAARAVLGATCFSH